MRFPNYQTIWKSDLNTFSMHFENFYILASLISAKKEV